MRSAISSRLLGRRLRQQERELLSAEAGGDVGVPEVQLEDAGDPAQDGVPGEVPVGVVDLAEQVEVGHDQRHRGARPLGPLELVPDRGGEVARVEEARLRVDPGLLLERRDTQRAMDEEERRDCHRQRGTGSSPRGRRAPRPAWRARSRSRGSRSRRGRCRAGSARARNGASSRAGSGSARRRRPRPRGRRARTRAPG